MTVPNFWWRRRSRASTEDRPGPIRRVLDRLNNISDSAAPPFRFPLDFAGRIALLEGGFRQEGNIREFTSSDLRWLGEYAPEALVAPLDLALSLADQKLRGHFDLPSLKVALVVLTRLGDSPLEDHHRDLLWRAFEVPVFEQIRDLDGAVIARECEAHDGLHIVEPAVIPHLTAAIVREHCECGSETPRLRHAPPFRRKAAAAAG